MPDSNILFISHNAADRPYAAAVEAAILELLDDDTLIDVRYSTSDEAGPQGGEQWREWIYTQVVEARTAIIVVTPHALGRPWLLWEAGACWGAALAQKAVAVPDEAGDEGEMGSVGRRLNVSIAYGLTENECPDPLRGDQIIPGANRERVNALLQRIMQVHGVPSRQLFRAGERMQGVLDRYLERVRTSLLKTPSLEGKLLLVDAHGNVRRVTSPAKEEVDAMMRDIQLLANLEKAPSSAILQGLDSAPQEKASR